MTLNHGFTMRSADMDDLEPVVALMNACSLKAVGKADDSVEDIGSDWTMPGFDQAASQRVILSPEGQIVGFAEVRNYPRPMYPFLDVYVHPDYEDAGITAPLVEWSEERACEAIPTVPEDARVAMQAATYDLDTWYKSVLESIGMTVIRHHWRMDIELHDAIPEPEWAEGIALRTMIPGQDERKVLEAKRSAFRDHWGNVERPFEEDFESWWHTWQTDGEFDPTLWFLAMDRDEIAGIALCKNHAPGEENGGWVSTLGVRPEYRRQGVGRALLLHAFREFLKRGKDRVGLGVDASSLTGATRLYQKAGMSIAMQIDLYEKELRPGRDLAIRG